ncbi:MAG TPA: hypothetical protein VHV08_06790 [Pirellulales bacterium]|jgi:hypothetical protein|nr:hypothetical protein [Pirellulales bacterium]
MGTIVQPGATLRGEELAGNHGAGSPSIAAGHLAIMPAGMYRQPRKQ